jgi:hypothetical protein
LEKEKPPIFGMIERGGQVVIQGGRIDIEIKCSC